MISSDVIRGYNDTIILSLLLEQPSGSCRTETTLSRKQHFIPPLTDWNKTAIPNPFMGAKPAASAALIIVLPKRDVLIIRKNVTNGI